MKLDRLVVVAVAALFLLACGGNGTTSNQQGADQTRGDTSNSGYDTSAGGLDTSVPSFDIQLGTPDTNVVVPDTNVVVPDTNAEDVVVKLDTQLPQPDTNVADANVADTNVADTTVTDSNIEDTTVQDTSVGTDTSPSGDTHLPLDSIGVPDVVDLPDVAVVPDTVAPTGIPSLGGGTHSTDSVKIEVIADTSNTVLSTPRDLAFNPMYSAELWIVNYQTESMTVIFNTNDPSSGRVHRQTDSGHHFLARPSSLAFGKLGFLATSHETDIKTQDSTPADFMGPTLYTSDLQEFDGGWGGHYDMLHNSPNGMGIAWEKDNVYWVFDGYHSSLTRYDFQSDHGAAGSDHSDGIVLRYVEGKVKRVAGVPSHLYYVPASKLLYVADTGNNRIAVLDTTSGTVGSDIEPNYDGGTQKQVLNATITTLIAGSSVKMERPSGLEIHKDVLYVTDNKNSVIYAFDLQGKLLDYLQISQTIPSGSMMGIALDSSNRIYLVDSKGNRIIRLSPK